MYFRKQNKINEVEINEKDVFHLMEEINEEQNEQKIEKLLEKLNELPTDQMDLIDMRFFERMSFKEIGDLIGITEGNAKIKVYRVLDKLKKMLTTK